MPAQQLTEKEKNDFMRQATSGLIVVPGGIFQRALTPSAAPTDLSVDMAPLKGLPARTDGKPTESDLDLINRFAPSGSVDPESIYCFNTAPSTQRIDSHYTRMDVSSLQNYALEAVAGAPVMNSHKTGGWLSDAQLPIGRSFWGGVENAPNGNGKRFVSAAYMRRGSISNGETNTDSIIADIDAGIIGDVSIGFALLPGTPENDFKDRSWLRCSICGQDWLSADPWSDDPDDCQHWPGQVYKSDGGKQQDLCFLDVMNAHLREYSPCYAGSTPGAVILKAKRSADSGRLDRSLIRQLEDSYNVRLVDRGIFQVPIIDEIKKGKGEGASTGASEGDGEGEVKPRETETDQTRIDDQQPNNESERNETQMAVDKQALDNARGEGAKLALANLAKTILDNRTLNKFEAGMVVEFEKQLAADNTEQAGVILGRLMSLPENENGEGENEGEGEGETDLLEGVRFEGGNTDNGNGEGPAVDDIAVISVQLTNNQRQQFRALERDNARLKTEVKRLTPLAETGQHYMDALIDATCR
jgi:hypothetical protein